MKNKILNVLLRIDCADMDRLLGELVMRKIELFNVCFVDEISVTLEIKAKNYFPVLAIVNRLGGQVTVINQSGPFLLLKALKARKVLVIGIFMMIIISAFLSRTVLFIQVDGNRKVGALQILNCAEDHGLKFGTQKSSIRSERIKNALLESIPDLQWVGVNTTGCVATISVKERIEQMKQPVDLTSSIIASKEGIIQQVTVTKGMALCAKGQAVNKGDVLISAITNNHNITVVSGADGEIYANTVNDVQLISMRQINNKCHHSSTETNISIIFGKKLINLCKDSGILYAGCDKMYSEKDVRLPGGFILPIKLCIVRVRSYEYKPIIAEHKEWMEAVGRAYIHKQMISGRIIDQTISEDIKDQFVILSIRYSCCEMIGKTQIEEIFVFDGKNYRTNRECG